MKDKLEKGANVADVGCGHGISTILMAKAYPNSSFVGFDNYKPSLEVAEKMLYKRGWIKVGFVLN